MEEENEGLVLSNGRVNETVLKWLEFAFAHDANVVEACAYAGISKNTYYDLRRKSVDFRSRIDQARAYPTFLAKQTVYQRIREGDGKLALEVLKSRAPEFKGEKDKDDVDDDGNLNINIIGMEDNSENDEDSDNQNPQHLNEK